MLTTVRNHSKYVTKESKPMNYQRPPPVGFSDGGWGIFYFSYFYLNLWILINSELITLKSTVQVQRDSGRILSFPGTLEIVNKPLNFLCLPNLACFNYSCSNFLQSLKPLPWELNVPGWEGICPLSFCYIRHQQWILINQLIVAEDTVWQP